MDLHVRTGNSPAAATRENSPVPMVVRHVAFKNARDLKPGERVNAANISELIQPEPVRLLVANELERLGLKILNISDNSVLVGGATSLFDDLFGQGVPQRLQSWVEGIISPESMKPFE